MSMGHLITSIQNLPKFQCLWLTPVLKNEHLLSQIKQVKHRALFVIGTADPYYDKRNLDELLQATGGESITNEALTGYSAPESNRRAYNFSKVAVTARLDTSNLEIFLNISR